MIAKTSLAEPKNRECTQLHQDNELHIMIYDNTTYQPEKMPRMSMHRAAVAFLPGISISLSRSMHVTAKGFTLKISTTPAFA
jgi:hypothetical protein